MGQLPVPRTAQCGAVQRLLLLTLAAGVTAALLAWWLVPWRAPPAAPAPIAPAQSVRAAAPGPEPAPRNAAAAPPATAAVVRAGLKRHFAGLAVPRELIELLGAGEVAAVAQRLEGMPGRSGAALLWDLGTLCREARGPASGTDLRGADARAALDAASLDANVRLALEGMVAARRAWLARLEAGCAAARLDAGALQRRLLERAEAGDAASLERLATVDAAPVARMMSAALLGAPRAQLRLALRLLEEGPGQSRTGEQRQAGLMWLQSAAKADPDAEGYYGACLLTGCYGAPDPVAARDALEHAARYGSSAALGLLATAGTGDAARWSSLDEPLAAVPPRDTSALALSEAERYAWAALAERLARAGCFGFDFAITGEALGGRARLERTLRPSQLAEAAAAADRLWSESGAAARAARGCD